MTSFQTVITILSTILVALITGGALIIIARRQFSGKVSTATGDALLAMSQSLTKDFADRYNKAEKKIDEQNEMIEDFKNKTAKIEVEYNKHRLACQRKIAQLQRRIVLLEKERDRKAADDGVQRSG